MDDPLPVKRCVCFDITFKSLKAAGVRSPEEAASRFGSGTKCGSCMPYVERMASTGEVEFEVLEPNPPKPA